MARPSRNAHAADVQENYRTFFVTSKTSLGRALLQTERIANLLIDVLRSYVAAKKFRLHDFVVMPDHFHLLLTLDRDMTVDDNPVRAGLTKSVGEYQHCSAHFRKLKTAGPKGQS